MASSNPAPQITVNITSAKWIQYIKILPDSGADISASGREILVHLNEQPNRFMLSNVIPTTVNGTEMLSHSDWEIKHTWKIYTSI